MPSFPQVPSCCPSQEKFMIAERTQQQQQRAEMTSTGSGLTVPPEVLKAQGIANWIVIVMVYVLQQL